MSVAKVIQLRQMLAERFPGLRNGTSGPQLNVWPTGFSTIDAICGGFPKGKISEVVAENRHCGSTTLIHALLHRAVEENKVVTFIDSADTLDVCQIDEAVLHRMVWVRCRSAEEAMKAADLVLRDNNFPLVFLDMVSSAPSKLRKISATAWYRFQRLMEETSTVCAVFTPQPMVTPASVRIALKSRLPLHALEKPSVEILREIEVAVLKTPHGQEQRSQNIAG